MLVLFAAKIILPAVKYYVEKLSLTCRIYLEDSDCPSVACLNSDRPLPRDLPNSGSFPGPKMISARTNKITPVVGVKKPKVKKAFIFYHSIFSIDKPVQP